MRKDKPGDSTDYGFGALEAEVAKLAKTPDSPEAYRTFHRAIEALRPRFNQTVAAQAERQLVFFALGPLARHAGEPPAEQLEALALTVWPMAFHEMPADGETAWQFAERLCSRPLASDCKHLVPEAWPLALATLAIRRVNSRAREAYTSCQRCEGDKSYTDALERYSELSIQAGSAWTGAKRRASPEAWPRAGDHAAAWTKPAVLLSLGTDGEARIDDEAVDEGLWRQEISRRRSGAEVLGVHLRPTDDVRTLRSVARAAGAAGYDEIALMSRLPSFPWTPREYRIAVQAGRGPKLAARDEDTIAVLVRALDVAAGDVAAGQALRL